MISSHLLLWWCPSLFPVSVSVIRSGALADWRSLVFLSEQFGLYYIAVRYRDTPLAWVHHSLINTFKPSSFLTSLYLLSSSLVAFFVDRYLDDIMYCRMAVEFCSRSGGSQMHAVYALWKYRVKHNIIHFPSHLSRSRGYNIIFD